MSEHTLLIESITRRLDRGEPAALATILHQDGSTPRTAGARMLVTPDGVAAGTVGGGQAEGMAQAICLEMLTNHQGENARARLMVIDMAGGEQRGDTDMDMICGGRLEMLLEVVAPGGMSHVAFSAAAAALRRHHPVTLATRLSPVEGDAEAVTLTRCALVQGDNDTAQHGAPFPGDTLDALGVAESPAWRLAQDPQNDARWLVETHAPPATVYLFGAGHVAQATAAVAALAGFRVVALDDRPEFACRSRFPQADRVIILESFDNIFTPESLDEPMDARSHLVIVTRGHSHDGLVLRQALATEAGYIGMIGSRSKREATYAKMREHGFTDVDLARVHSPIGIAIGAQTPEEIGVSIVAELIQRRHENNT